MHLSTHRVAWTEGILLEPQHFQQQERHFEYLTNACMRSLQAHCWGFSQLKLDDTLLEQGLVGLQSASGLFADGTPFSLPFHAPLPLPYAPEADCIGEEICLVIPLDIWGNSTIDIAADTANARFHAALAEVPDRNYGISPEATLQIATLQLGQLQTRLMRKSDASSGATVLPVARIRERLSNGALQLDHLLLPPLLDVHGYGWLVNATKEFIGLFVQRLRALEQLSRSDTGGLSYLLELLVMQTLGEYRLALQHSLNVHPLHPERLFQQLLGLLGRLSTIPGGAQLVGADKEFPYRHDDLSASFQPLISTLRKALSLIIESPSVALDFRNRDDNIQVCLNDPLLRLDKIIFVVSANCPSEALRNYFPAQTKFGPVEKIVRLIELQLPGAKMTAVPTAPRHIPYYPNSVYFEVAASDAMWPETLSGSAMALSVVGDFPGLRMEVWGLREGRGA